MFDPWRSDRITFRSKNRDAMVIEPHIRDFLMQLRTNETRHSGRTLFEHLKGVHDLLRDWGNDTDVCMAGLFHSIYGTKVFKHKSMDSRTELGKMIGWKAEALVHYFATKDRPFFESIHDEKLRKNLLEIEAANLLEQGGNPDTLRKLARMRELSNGARAALNCGVI